jgi:mevalonate kinase
LAFGKAILLGEHAVVYGHSALAGALERGVVATARANGGARSSIEIPAWNARVTSDDVMPLGAALSALVHEVAGPDRGFDVTVTAELPPGAGLGSSAALSVAVTRALAAATGASYDIAEVERVANLAERAFHDNPSGIDVALAARGGLGVYRRDTGLEPVQSAPLPIAVGLSGEARTTAAMVRKVAAAVEADRGNARRLESLGETVDYALPVLERGDMEQLGKLLDTGHELLAQIGVSTATLDLLVRTARDAGALGAKLTGAGGGGAVIALAPGHEAAVIDAWRDAGFDGFACHVGVSG